MLGWFCGALVARRMSLLPLVVGPVRATLPPFRGGEFGLRDQVLFSPPPHSARRNACIRPPCRHTHFPKYCSVGPVARHTENQRPALFKIGHTLSKIAHFSVYRQNGSALSTLGSAISAAISPMSRIRMMRSTQGPQADIRVG
jgi:hypothetical protein